MILSKEISHIAAQQNLRPEVIEKDYVLGWLIAAIHHHDESKNWRFKGGTCLKKCYFKDYRFSEDADYSTPEGFDLNETSLDTCLTDWATWVYDRSGIVFAKNPRKIEVFTNLNNRVVAQIRLYYQGPISPKSPRQWPRVKLDITSGEILTDSGVIRPINHPYQDDNHEIFQAYCYSFTELFAEKLRALVERSRPRDIYDVVKCFEANLITPSLLKEHFNLKMTSKEIKMPKYEDLLKQMLVSKELWHEQMAHQLANLEPFEIYYTKLQDILKLFL